MQNKLFLKAADICELLEVKQTSAYEIIGNLNKELEEQGYLTLRGKVPTKYFVKRFYGVEDTCEIPQAVLRVGLCDILHVLYGSSSDIFCRIVRSDVHERMSVFHCVLPAG